MTTTTKRGNPSSGLRTIAHFERPPIAETSLGFYFSPLPEWNVAHYGLIWEEFRAQYPKPEFRPPVGPSHFEFNPNADLTAFPLRAWFVESTNNQLLQVQNGAFLRNWRKTPELPQYQHYDEIRPIFHRDWDKFAKFVKANFDSAPQVLRSEISYFNHLERGREWSDFSQLSAIFPAWKGFGSDSLLSKPQMVAFSSVYGVPTGTVQFAMQPAIRTVDGKEIIQLTITSQSSPKKQTEEELHDCLDRCHETAVKGFLEFTSGEMHTKWQRTR